MPAPPRDLDRLRTLIERLRAPDGCPWDREQRPRDLRAYLLEEAHEVAAAVDRGDWVDLQGELGDLLFQVVFLAALAEEAGEFDLDAVVETVHAKMIARHPHVFDGGEALADATAVREAWERRKLRVEGRAGSLLDGVAASLPALVASYRLTQKAAGVAFDWADAGAVFAKLDEELAELRAAVAAAETSAGNARGSTEVDPGVRAEVGDLLFTLANLARKLGVDPEGALAETNLKFRRRFAAVERGLAAAGRPLGEATLEEMDALWASAKAEE